MTASPAVRVGIIVFIALVALGAAAWFLTGYQLRIAGYNIIGTFNDAQGLSKGSEVRLAGVVIGYVDRIDLDRRQRAVITMRINRMRKIPVGSTFTLRVGLLIGEKYIDIQPNRRATKFLRPGTVVRGIVPPRIEDLLPQIQQVLNGLNRFTDTMNTVIGNKDFQERLDRSFQNIEHATRLLDQTMSVIHGAVAGQEDEMQAIIGNVQRASDSLADLSRELQEFAEGGGLQENVQGTLESARGAAESLERTATNLEQLVTAPEFQEDVRETVKGAREAIEEAREVIGRVGGFLGGGRRARIQTRETRIEGLYISDDGHFRATLQTTVPQKDDRFLNLGLYDLGGENKIILQAGQPLGSRTDLRYGLYASRLSLGLDYGFSPKSFGTLNLYDPNDPRLDFEVGYRVSDDWHVLLGVDKLLDENQVTLGARWTR